MTEGLCDARSDWNKLIGKYLDAMTFCKADANKSNG
jgi:hypothetical protein